MDFWRRARNFAEEAAKQSQELTHGIGSITAQLPPSSVLALSNLVDSSKKGNEVDLEKYGVTDELREFAKGITISTFQEFPLEDDSEISDFTMVSNVRQDLNEWQEKHAKLVLSTVKEISKLRYELCPRVMKERKFWRIYFILVNSHVAPYEKKYMEDLKQNHSEKIKDAERKEISSGVTSSKTVVEDSNQKSSNAKSSASEQDLDVFLLGDLEDSDNGPDDGEDGFEDEFDKI
ncbi:BSD domain-containing protein [Abeliophyllum distichum]|uniref:BSD domain-containing protein n=1 Tax=Abeliophyllum distichum TaxID=126358 RepID=A0ABD1PQ22_9LAMI